MRITRCSDQKSRTLDEFYTDLYRSADSVSREIGESMLSLLAKLRALPDDRVVWGLTSHCHLMLRAEDTYTAPWFVSFIATKERYTIEYPVPAAVAPWRGAVVRGETSSEDEALQMIITAMEKSEGWKTTKG